MRSLNLLVSLAILVSLAACGKKKGGGSSPAPAAPAVVAPVVPVAKNPARCAAPTTIDIGYSETISTQASAEGVRKISDLSGLYPDLFTLRTVVVTQSVRDANGNTQGSYVSTTRIRNYSGKKWIFSYNYNKVDTDFDCIDNTGAAEYKEGLKRTVTLSSWVVPQPNGLGMIQGSFMPLSLVSLPIIADWQTVPQLDKSMYQLQGLGDALGKFLPGPSHYYVPENADIADEVLIVNYAPATEMRTSGATKMWVDTSAYFVYRWGQAY